MWYPGGWPNGDPLTGYKNPIMRGMAFERPVTMSYIDPVDNSGIQADCGIRVQGSDYSRHRKIPTAPEAAWVEYYNRFSHRLCFRSDYGTDHLKYPLFPDCELDETNTIVMRGGHNDFYDVFIRDELVRRLLTDCGQLQSHGALVNMFLNGHFKGFYNAVERVDNGFFQIHRDSENDWDIVIPNATWHLGGEWTNEMKARNGDLIRHDEIIGFLRTHDFTVYANYQAISEMVDLENYVDYLLINMYADTRDWPHTNFIAARERTPSGKYRFYSWDAEVSFWSGYVDHNNMGSFDSNYYLPHCLYYWLKSSPEFKLLFADRIQKHFADSGGALTDENVLARHAELRDQILPMFEYFGFTYDNLIEDYWVPQRTGYLIGFISDAGLWPGIMAPSFDLPEGEVLFGTLLSIADIVPAQGTIYYTTDGTDPRQPGTGAAIGTMYSSPIPINETVQVKARILKNGNQWSSIREGTFIAGLLTDNLRITEIMYHPQEMGNPNDPNEEFIELKNIGTETLSLNNASFTEGIHFTFGQINLAPDDYVVLVRNQAAFNLQYPGFTGIVAGEYNGSLDNGGERVRLQNAVGQTIMDFEYKDDWYDITDGDGFSLTVKYPNSTSSGDLSSKDAWRPSAALGGSPGYDDSGVIPDQGSVVINELLGHSDAEPYDWIELHNTTDTIINIGGWFLSDNDNDDPNRMKYEIAFGTTVDPNDYIVFYENLHFNNPSDPGCHVPFALSENGETLYLQSGQNGNLTGYYNEESFGASSPDIAFGRYYKASTDAYNFVAMSLKTPDAANAYPKIGPVVINEIMYNPDWPSNSLYDNDEYEYIELHNISDEEVTLYDYTEGVAWKFTDGVDYTFPASPAVTMPAGGYILVVKNPTAFAWRYGAMPGVTILGPYENDTNLSNGGEKLEISMPGDMADGTRYYIRVDRVNYSDGSHPGDFSSGIDLWPTAPDGGGSSLSRKVQSNYGNDVDNWKASASSPGATNP